MVKPGGHLRREGRALGAVGAGGGQKNTLKKCSIVLYKEGIEREEIRRKKKSEVHRERRRRRVVAVSLSIAGPPSSSAGGYDSALGTAPARRERRPFVVSYSG